MSTAESSYFTATGKCGHAICYDDDGHSDGCRFEEATVIPTQTDAGALDAIAELLRQDEWKVDGSAASFIEEIAARVRPVRAID